MGKTDFRCTISVNISINISVTSGGVSEFIDIYVMGKAKRFVEKNSENIITL